MGTEYTVLGRRIRIHDREEWQIPSQAITGPDPSPELVHWGICHYPGAARDWVPPVDTASHLRWANALYLADPNRGYSYGYGFVIGANPVDWTVEPWVFDVWEVRGFDIRIASNNGDFPPWSDFEDPNFNGRSCSVQIMCSYDHPATLDQRLQFRYMMAVLDQVYGETVTVQPHQASDQTDCPGPCMDVMAELSTRPPEEGDLANADELMAELQATKLLTQAALDEAKAAHEEAAAAHARIDRFASNEFARDMETSKRDWQRFSKLLEQLEALVPKS
jgi:hypothetical protein